MRSYPIIMIVLIIGGQLAAGAWQWASGFGSQGMESAWDLATGPSNEYFYVSGEYTDSLTVNGVSYPSNGQSDCFIIKYSASGQVQWVKTFGSTEGDVCLSVSADAAGNCYFTGFFSESIALDGYFIQGAGQWDVFYGKLAPNGGLLWIKCFGGVQSDMGYGIAATDQGDFYVTGWFADTITLSDTVSLTSYGGSDIYLIKFDTNGDPLWARHAGTVGVEYGYKVDVDVTGSHVYITGQASPGSNFNGITTDAMGMFVAQYDSSGNIQWVLPSCNAGAINISADHYDPVDQEHAVIGRVTGTGTIGNTTLNSVDGSDDIYIAWFDSFGNWTNVEHYGGPGSDKGRAIDIGSETAELCSFAGQVDFGGTTLYGNGYWDIGILQSQHAPISARSVNSDVGTDIKAFGPGKFIVTGWFSGALKFGSHILDSGSEANLDVFVAVYDRLATSVDDQTVQVRPGLAAHPNPSFGGFTIEAKNSTRIDVYNLRGQLVRRLQPEAENKGVGLFRWDGRDRLAQRCPAGVYLLRSDQSSSRVLLLDQ
ncbi:MAG: T9SS type A sorting domain-containing protein [Candidatus Syntrophosphaera sp.]|nr:T9SS type A sorting domain-containing protein [Candidatus Syntrophosphaera sp.]